MAGNKRCYKQFCGLARALDIIGERWTLLIMRDLMLGPWRYSDLLERMQGITTNLLATRLKEMEQNGLIKKARLSSLGSPHVYELTELGQSLEPAILSLSQFGFNFMQNGPEEDEQMDPGWALLNLKARSRKNKKGIVTLCFPSMGAAASERCYQVDYSADRVKVRYGANSPSPVKVTMELKTYGDIAFRSISPSMLEKKKQITLKGEKKAWLQFLDTFALSK